MGDIGDVMAIKILDNALVDLFEDQGVVKECRADADGARPGNEELKASAALVIPPWPMMGIPWSRQT